MTVSFRSLYIVRTKGGNMMLAFWKRIHGINLWKLNRTLLKLSKSKISLEEQMNNGMITIYFQPRHSQFLIGNEQKKEIEESIQKLEGFEILRLTLLEECMPVYKEQRTLGGVSRWLEIRTKQMNEEQAAS
jgi:hypothetical protein